METPRATHLKSLHPVLGGVDKRVQTRGVAAARAREINLTSRENEGRLGTSSRVEYSGRGILAGIASV